MEQMHEAQPKLPTRTQAFIFAGKVRVLRARRTVRNVVRPIRKLTKAVDSATCVLASSSTPLWTESHPSEQRLQLGKVHNLRLVCRAIDGLHLNSGDIFSFWRQVGNPSRHRGFVPGRQIQEGCIIPAIGGGICQLSNVLYSCALDAGCEILERHPHTRALSASSPSFGRDATVAWNHIDLRFRSSVPLRIAAALTRESLEVRFVSETAAQASQQTRFPRVIQSAESCETCGQDSCYRHDAVDRSSLSARTAFVVNRTWPEFVAYLREHRIESDPVYAPLDGKKRNQAHFEWTSGGDINEAVFLYLHKVLRSRGLSGGDLRRAGMDFEARFAAAVGRRMPLDVRHVTVSMSLLPHLWRGGWLGGRSFDVLADRLPIHEIQSLLDTAFAEHPDRALLADFRAPTEIARAEADALAAADRIVTPSAYVAELFGHRALKLPWSMPPRVANVQGCHLAYAGPTAARKGAYEVREAAQRLGLTLVLSGSELEGDGFWDGVNIIRSKSLDGCFAVVQPAVVEDQPRRLLEALASGVPVIATDVCGLGQLHGVTTVEPGDVDGLVAAITAIRHEAS